MPIALIIILIFACGINYYLARRYFQCFKFLFPKTVFLLYIAIFVVITLFILLGFFRSMLPISQGVRDFLCIVSAYCMGFFVYMLLFTVLTDVAFFILTLFKKLSITRELLRFVCGITAIGLTFVTVVYGFYNAKQLKVVNYDIVIEDNALENELNIVLISDVHLGAIGAEDRLESIVAKINSLNPDIICIAGDFFDNDYNAIKDPEGAIETLKKLQSKYGTYLCFGNHDSGSTVPQMKEFLEKSEIHPLYDESVIIDGKFVLVGRLDKSPIGGYRDMERKDTNELLAEIDTSLPIIVMEHNPARIDEYPNEVDLILSGHTHKGQIFPGAIITDIMYTVDHGYYRENTTSPHVIVSSGVGTWGMPMRVGTRSEIVQITLHS